MGGRGEGWWMGGESNEGRAEGGVRDGRKEGWGVGGRRGEGWAEGQMRDGRREGWRRAERDVKRGRRER